MDVVVLETTSPIWALTIWMSSFQKTSSYLDPHNIDAHHHVVTHGALKFLLFPSLTLSFVQTS